MAINSVMGRKEWGLLLLLSLLWGGSFFFVGIAVKQLPPFTIVALRLGLAALALWSVLLLSGQKMPMRPGVWLAFFAMGFLNNAVPFSLIVWGQTQIASGLASIFNATTPIFAVLVAHFLTGDEKFSVNKFAGVIAGFSGVAVMIGPGLLSGLSGHAFGEIAVLAAALSYAFAGVFGRRFKRMGIAPLATATGQVTAAAIILLPVSLVVDHPLSLPMPGAATWSAVIGIALLSTALAYILYFRILMTAGATNLLLVTFLVPVSAILLGWLFLGEVLALRSFIGMAMIAIGLAAIDGRILRRVGLLGGRGAGYRRS